MEMRKAGKSKTKAGGSPWAGGSGAKGEGEAAAPPKSPKKKPTQRKDRPVDFLADSKDPGGTGGRGKQEQAMASASSPRAALRASAVPASPRSPRASLAGGAACDAASPVPTRLRNVLELRREAEALSAAHYAHHVEGRRGLKGVVAALTLRSPTAAETSKDAFRAAAAAAHAAAAERIDAAMGRGRAVCGVLRRRGGGRSLVLDCAGTAGSDRAASAGAQAVLWDLAERSAPKKKRETKEKKKRGKRKGRRKDEDDNEDDDSVGHEDEEEEDDGLTAAAKAPSGQLWFVDPVTGRVGPHSARPEAKAVASGADGAGGGSARKAPRRPPALVLGLADGDAAVPRADAPLSLGAPRGDDGNPLKLSSGAALEVGPSQHWTLTHEGLLVLTKHREAHPEEEEGGSGGSGGETHPVWAAGLASTGRIFPMAGSEVVLVPVGSARVIKWDIELVNVENR